MANMQSMNRTEALRLADALSQGRYLTTDAGNPIAEAAAELRRLHAELAQLREKRQPLTDEEIENVVQRCGGLWSGDYWIIEDADLHPIARTFAAHNITGEPA